MEPLRLQAVAARVVAWHNRHPLARPITAAHVYSIGYVALPFRTATVAEPAADAPPAGAQDGGSLRERAMARAMQGESGGEPPAPPPPRPAAEALQGAFSEDFIAPLKQAQVARWAARHGRTLAERPEQAPLREVLEDARLAKPPHAVTLYVLTAAVEIGKRRTRVLVGGGHEPQILGRRLWDWPRLGALLGVAALVVGGAALGVALFRGHGTAADAMPSVSQSASAADEAASASASAAASAPAPPLALASAEVSASEPAALRPHEFALPPASEVAAQPASAPPLPSLPAPDNPASPPAAASPPPDETPSRPGRIALPSLSQIIPESAKAQARAAKHAREGTPPAAAAAAAPGAAQAAPPHEPAWAISTRPLRTRTEAEQVLAAMEGLLKPIGTPGVRTEILPEGDDWRVVGWPYTDRREADRALAVLMARGMRVQVLAF
jgi:hypothetical protein